MALVGRFLFVVVFPALVVGDCTVNDPDPCDLADPKVVSAFSFNGTCNEKGWPVLQIGNFYDLSITFTPVETYKTAKSVVKVVTLGLEFPVNIENPDACVDKNLTCPLEADKEVVFDTTFSSKTSFIIYSPIKVEIKWSLVAEDAEDNKGRRIFCAKVPIVIEPKPKDNALLFSPE